ncbi:protein LNK2 isoform X1 [Mercurialis annua]|uniref:protein LNK2 isoform X1 n=1 Tax=Mercurialis annua TaxID=3986 RepID=UPI00215E6BD3|nr:protein LNK2 isoform X1 [Mercurialis annua]XP_050234129.1 protein LNK2 isoform X1 [Mercurialis annua]
MFDWNDEELNNIVWDEAGQSDDHIVPYPESVEEYSKKKEWNQEDSNTKSNVQKAPGAKVDIHGIKLESSSNFSSSEGTSASGLAIASWPNLSLSTASRTDQDSFDTSVSNNLTDITKFETSGGAETVQVDKESELFQKGKEQGDFVDYGWANIGSFDDLDRIFSNDDPIFGNVSLSNPDELWSTCKDVTNSPGKSFPIYSDSPTLGLGPLRSTPDYFEIKTENVQDDNQPFTLDYGKVNDPGSHGLQNPSNVLNQVECMGGKSRPGLKEQTNLTIASRNATANSQLAGEKVAAPNELTEKVYKKKKTLKSRKKLEEQSEPALYEDIYGNWSAAGRLPGQYKNQFAPNIIHSPPSVLNQPRQLQGPESLQFQKIPNPLMAPSAYGTVTNPYSVMPVLSHFQSGEFKHQPAYSGYEVSSGNANPVNKSADSLVKIQTMTPQEKIEKLRKRQQMQAMLAIQKQLEQFGHQVSCNGQSLTQKSSLENQIQLVEGADLEVEDLSAFPAFDPNSPLEQDDSSTISLAINDYSAEDTVLYRLQNIIDKLDVSIRLCIRDSLFRLAQSAMQRHYSSDTSSINNSGRDEQVATKDDVDAHNRNAKMSEIETETNPVDRTVAHLLFHRPMELSGNTPQSPASNKCPSEQKALSIATPSIGCFPETGKSKQILSHQGSKSSYPPDDPRLASRCENSVCIDTLDNASNIGPADEGAKDVEACQ